MDILELQWHRSRHGSNAGRGFHFQDSIATHLSILGWSQALPIQSIIPEGHEDISVQSNDAWIQVQAKSRRAYRGDFPLSEVAGFLASAWIRHAERLKLQPHSRLVLVLERNTRGFRSTGWESRIKDDSDLVAALVAELAGHTQIAGFSGEILELSSIVVVPEPRELDLTMLSEVLGLPRGACIVHYNALLTKLSELSDRNGTVGFQEAASLSMSDVQILLNQQTSLVDLDALDEAIRQGICEPVDFLGPKTDSRFYEGVDVVPGHVVAGLTVERPELMTQIISAIDVTRSVLISGPSGAGKSALAWMAAHLLRHRIRWYRIMRLQESDITPLMRTLLAVAPSEFAPVGLVADDLGRGSKPAWDLIVNEINHRDGFRLIGAVRSEDIALISTASTMQNITPELDQELAERIWRELKNNNKSHWGDWREPYELSAGHLLEFGFLLSTGERLEGIVDEQIERRLREGRSLELKILRVVSAVHSRGANVHTSSLRKLLSEQETDFDLQSALRRLVDEHLLQVSDIGVIVGLHQVRSDHIFRATHRLGIPSIRETVALAISMLDRDELQVFVFGFLKDRLTDDDSFVTGLAERIVEDADDRTLASILFALRSIEFLRIAQRWPLILAECGVPPSKSLIATTFAIGEIDIQNEIFMDSIRLATRRLRGQVDSSLREYLLNRIPDDTFKEIVDKISDLTLGIQLLEGLVGTSIATNRTTMLGSLVHLVSESDITSVGEFLAVAKELNIDLAREYIAKSGGQAHLFSRVEQELMWIRNVRQRTSESGELCVFGDVRYASPSTQPDLHAEVVKLCKLLIAFAPDAEFAVCRGVDTNGELVQYEGLTVADKRIARRSLPSRTAVSWTQTRTMIAAAILGSPTRTERLLSEHRILEDCLTALETAGLRWCRGQRLGTELRIRIDQIEIEAGQLPPPNALLSPSLNDGSGASLFGPDPAHLLFSGILSVIRRLFEPDANLAALAAYFYDTVVTNSMLVADPRHWLHLSNPPIQSMQRMHELLGDLHQIIAESAFGGENARKLWPKLARRGSPDFSIAFCASVAESRASDRLRVRIDNLRRYLEEEVGNALVITRTTLQPKGINWPPQDIAVLIEVPSVFEWDSVVKSVEKARSAWIEPTRTVVTAPVRDGTIVASLGGVVQRRFYPIADRLDDWRNDWPLPILVESTAGYFVSASNALFEASAILSGSTNGNLPDGEYKILEHCLEKFREVYGRIESTEDDEDGIKTELLIWLNEAHGMLVNQLRKANDQSASPDPSLASLILDLARGRVTDFTQKHELLLLAAIETQIEPVGVIQRFTEAVNRSGLNSSER